jgi:RimJ/RimL family protein N-acetyltransferase
METKTVTIRVAVVEDAKALRGLRLEALQDRPEAFGSDYERESQLPLSHTEERLRESTNSATFVAVNESTLVGMAGIGQYHHEKTKHNAMIWGVYVQPAWRGSNISGQMIEACVDWAKQRSLKALKLAVVTTNTSAINSYLRAGFRIYGVEPKVIFYKGNYYDEFLMARDL